MAEKHCREKDEPVEKAQNKAAEAVKKAFEAENKANVAKSELDAVLETALKDYAPQKAVSNAAYTAALKAHKSVTKSWKL